MMQHIDVDKSLKKVQRATDTTITLLANPKEFLEELGKVPFDLSIYVEAIISKNYQDYFFRIEYDFWSIREATPYINGNTYGALAKISSAEAFEIARKYIDKLNDITTKGFASLKQVGKNNQHKLVGEIISPTTLFPSWRFQTKYLTPKKG